MSTRLCQLASERHSMQGWVTRHLSMDVGAKSRMSDCYIIATWIRVDYAMQRNQRRTSQCIMGVNKLKTKLASAQIEWTNPRQD